MKVLSSTGLAKLVELIKSAFVSKDDVVEADTIGIDDEVTANSENLITSGAVADGLAAKEHIGKITVGGVEYTVARRALEVTIGGQQTTVYVAELTSNEV